MKKLSHETLYTLEHYARIRPEFRARVIEHKKHRQVALGEHLTLSFEDALTMQYQVQEMLRLERLFEPELIQQELDVYNPLIPDGSNWKATLMIEYEDPDERRVALARLIGVEKAVWIRVAGHAPVRPVTNEDLDRETPEKTSSVHFLRFELDAAMISDLKAAAGLALGVDHPAYRAEIPVLEDPQRAALLADLD
jgi:hypothetical protein